MIINALSSTTRRRGRSAFGFRYLVCLLAVGLYLAFPLSAAEPPQRLPFDVAAGEAGKTLKLFARQAQREIIFPVRSVSGVMTNTVQGEYTVREALDRLLEGTGLVAIEDEKTGALVVERRSGPEKNVPGRLAASQTAPKESPDNSKPRAGDSRSDENQVIQLGTFVVTGSVTPATKLESALAVTTISHEDLVVQAPRSVADALKLVPGFYTEASGGEVANVVYARGFPEGGGYDFIMFQEDGLPVISEAGLFFATTDQTTKINTFIANIEVLRGGPSSIFQSNAPGGIVNFITREGDQEVRGEVGLQTSDYGQLRSDFWISGPAGKTTTFALGGFYNMDHSPRDPGYRGNRGGQLQGNIKYGLPNGRGYVKASSRWLDYHALDFTPIPLANPADPHTIPGGIPMKTGAINTVDMARFFFPGTPDGDIDLDLRDGIHTRLFYAGTEISYDLGGGFKVENRNRYSTEDQRFNSLVALGTSSLQDIANAIASGANAGGQFAPALDASTGNYRFRVSQPGQRNAIVAPDAAAAASLNGNGLGLTNLYLYAETEFENFQNDLRLIKVLNEDTTTLSAGLYYAWLSEDTFWHFSNFLSDISPRQKRIDITYLDAAGAAIGQGTYNGLTQLGVASKRGTAEVTNVATYVNLDQKIAALNLNLGYRHETVEANGQLEGTAVYDLNTTATANPFGPHPALAGAVFGNGRWDTGDYKIDDHAFTVGANYAFSNRLAVSARYSRGYRMPASTDTVWASAGAPFDAANFPNQHVDQFELALKFSSRSMALVLTAFDSKLKDQLASGVVVDAGGNVVTQNSLRSVDVPGIELEGVWVPVRGLSVNLIATYQNPEYTSDTFVSGVGPGGQVVAVNIKGHRPTRIPREYGRLSASYSFPPTRFGNLSVNGSWQYTGERFGDDGNFGVLKAFSEFNAGVTLARSDGLTFRVQVANLFDSTGLTEGDPRLGQNVSNPDAIYANFRPVMPRNVIVSVTYSF